MCSHGLRPAPHGARKAEPRPLSVGNGTIRSDSGEAQCLVDVHGNNGSPDDPAGAVIDQTTLPRARSLGLDPAHFLSDNDSTGFFSRLGDLVETGPTWTNVNDFRAIVVDRP